MSELQGRGAVAVWVDIEAGARADADGWYVEEHLPERVFDADFTRATRLRAVRGAPMYLSLFEAPSLEAMANERYFALVRRISERSRRIRGRFQSIVRATFSVSSSGSPGLGGAWGSIRLAYRATDSAALLSRWMRDVVEPLVRESAGLVGSHLLLGAPEVRVRMDRERELGQADASADAAVLIEGITCEDVQKALDVVLDPAVLDRAGCAVASGDVGVYQLMYSVARG
jgi:hypothetical protein